MIFMDKELVMSLEVYLGAPIPNIIDGIFFLSQWSPRRSLITAQIVLSFLLQDACFQLFISPNQEWPWLQSDKVVLHILD